ncbi:MAG: glycine betaine ABC transporter substrate-binding protein [Bryobacteraceae bacterium]|nr:glycine betaine ABC transporter substrate-binding protein [Bryobacteraceae bacterium]
MKIAAIVALSLALAGCSRQPVVKVGAKGGTEQAILCEIVAQLIERKGIARTERRVGYEPAIAAHQALQAGDIDLYPEYTGVALTTILRIEPISESSIVLERVRQEYRSRMSAEWLNPLGFNSAFVLVVRGEVARARNLTTIADAAASTEPWTLGITTQFRNRDDGFASLMKNYRLPLKAAPRAMSPEVLFQAFETKSLDMLAVNRTEGPLLGADWTILADDRNAMSPYEAAIVVRQDTLAAVPQLRATIEALSGKIDNATMQRMNYEVDRKKRPSAQVASEWLRSAGL